MIMAKTNKSNSANEIKFNVTFGELNVNTMPANAAVLLRNAKKRIDGEMKETTEFMAIEGYVVHQVTVYCFPCSLSWWQTHKSVTALPQRSKSLS